MKKAKFIVKGIVAAISIGIMSIMVSSGVHAETSDTNVYIRNSNTFFAYVKNGEKLCKLY